MAHIHRKPEHALRDRNDRAVAVRYGGPLDGNGLSHLLQKGISNVVNARFGKQVIVFAVDKATNVTRWDGDFGVEKALSWSHGWLEMNNEG